MNIRKLVAEALDQHGAITAADDVGAQHIVETLSEALAKSQPVIHIHVNAPIPDAREGTEKILAALADISKQLAGVITTEGTLMTTIDDVLAKGNAALAAAQANTSLNQSIAAIVDHQAQQLADLQSQLTAAGTDPAKLQQLNDLLDAMQSAETANGKIVADKITANTPAATAGA